MRGICQFRHVAKSGNSFTVIFYGPKAFLRKTAQFLSMQCKLDSLGFPMKSTLCNAVKTCAKVFLELEIRCSIRLSYGRRSRCNMSLRKKENPVHR